MLKNWIKAILLLLLMLVIIIGAVLAKSPLSLQYWWQHPKAAFLLNQGRNPQVVALKYPPVKPLSAMALLGRKLFYDASLSGSGQLSCASCHNPAHAYAPANILSVQLGGTDMHQMGVRAVPSLTYLYRQPNFSIGPDNPVNEDTNLLEAAELAETHSLAPKQSIGKSRLVPQGGLFWDGRVDTLQQQAGGPLFNPLEMAAGSKAEVFAKLQQASYAKDFVQLVGPAVFHDPELAVQEALFAIARYQIEDASFHPFSSKFDAWLQGKARFTQAELRGYLAFNDPNKGNCAVCHLDKPTRDGLPPLFTDTQYEALGVPRNPAIPANQNPHYVDLGLCGPDRTDLETQMQYCGMFLTPTLRNVATRHAFFHNGYYHTLGQVLDFYRFRDIAPQKIYPVVHGKVQRFNDLPLVYQKNVDTQDAPFGGKSGDTPRLSKKDKQNIIAFLHTLTDGYMDAPH
jgi:cytochrome c peroxidase